MLKTERIGEEVYSFRHLEIEVNKLTFAYVCGEIRYKISRFQYTDTKPPDVEIKKVLSADIDKYSVFTRVGDDLMFAGTTTSKDSGWKEQHLLDWLEDQVKKDKHLLKEATEYERIYL